MTAIIPRRRRRQTPLASLLASDALARLITQFVLRPEMALHFQALKRVTGLPNRSLQNELARLARLGILRREPDGRVVRYRARVDHPGWPALRALVGTFADPADVLRTAVAQVPGVEAAFIYGSYARCTDIHSGSDVDVIVVGERVDEAPIRFSLAASALEVAGLIGREVNLVRYTPRRLRERHARGARFVRGVVEGQKRWLVGDEHTLGAHLRAGPSDGATTAETVAAGRDAGRS
ncbi:MAG: nucleotidyltransferase domain-containing protein [Gemmatimonadaceae bacterium]